MNYLDMPLEELETYCPPRTAAEDFDDFWEKTVAESKSQPLNAELSEIAYPVRQVRAYDVFFDGFRNSRIHGRYILPAGCSPEHPVPAVAVFHGYNWNNLEIGDYLKYCLMGYAVFLADVRGQTIKSPDHNRYGSCGAAGWMTSGILDPENYYYRSVYMDSARIIDFLLGREEIDRSRIAVTGGSQGGALTLAVAALCPEVRVAMADVPYLCHFRRAVRMATQMPYLEIAHFFRIQDPLHLQEERVYKTLSYFDNLNLASRIQADVLMAVGLEDEICPPSTSFAAYHQIRAYKEMRIYPDYGHGGFARQEEEKIKFIAKRFG